MATFRELEILLHTLTNHQRNRELYALSDYSLDLFAELTVQEIKRREKAQRERKRRARKP